MTGKKRIPDGILAMFPLDLLEVSSAPQDLDLSSDFYLLIQPKSGRHTENYTIYRSGSIGPPVFRRMTHRGATVIGVEEDTLRFSIRWLESKLNKWRQSSDLPVIRSNVRPI
jgi:hypothetical protein